MSERVTMPALGESVTEGTVTRWLKNVGDQVEVDEPLLEVSTDKVDTEIPSPVAGTLQEILAEEDETVEVGADLAVIGDGPAGEGDSSGGASSEGSDAAAQSTDAGSSDSGSSGENDGDAVDSAQDRNAVTEAGDEGGQDPASPQTDEPQQASPEAAARADEGTQAPAQAQQSEQSQQSEQQAAPQEQSAPASSGGSGGSTGGSTGSSGGGTKVTMPALGESVTEGTITRWLKAEGDEVAVDEPLLEVSTDKVDTEIPSPVAGTLTKILVQEDETVEVGADLAVVGGDAGGSDAGGSDDSGAQGGSQSQAASGEETQPSEPAPEVPAEPSTEQSEPEKAPDAEQEEPAQEQPEQKEPKQQQAPAETTQQSSGQTAQATAPAPQQSQQQAPAAQQSEQPKQQTPSAAEPQDASAYVTPLVRKLAAENGIDLASVKGTGVGGRIRKQDVLAAAEAAKAPAPAAEAPAAASGGAATPAAAAKPAAAAEDTNLRGTTQPMTRLRKMIAKRMVESLQTSAQLTTVVEVDVTKISRLRDRAKGDFARREGTKLSFLPFFTLAAVEALKVHPTVNASIEDDNVVYHGTENVGMAVDTEKGLIVPVVKNAGNLNIAGLARAIADVAERTRTNKITPDDLAGGTFTITNTGSRGALFDTPIINQPQVAILGTGAVVKRPVVVTDADGGETIAIRSMVYLALSYDHRIVDGADAARFLSTVKERLEEGNFEADLGL
ncbi:2-oxoglutarate dehydrogenase E2 component [Knoellia remsis]|uniref:Dihydrolipoamide acetyltransferase component of pyruvate dehydrogenase complex n=1 Tax=Knoellia remsis TaxID=407159 RepID=A0A2T0UXP0_9MICO|nr:2-oxoglutarate dehydrogenase, E2 component, dihydrolipoamide succinyltransferase [Knoellia remsis]PRY62693.1 2-oxoglutarate dehydrogenase E2 component [Knoellia remsis]